MKPDLEKDGAMADTRALVMKLLARSTRDELDHPLTTYWPNLSVRVSRAPETGLVMLRGRTGGDGAAFNLGEATVSRAVIELDTGERGYGQMLGRDREHARLAAIIEALAQRAADRDRVWESVLEPIRARIAAEDMQKRAEIAATRVEFFTLVRAEG